jgi:hypothetical protein
MNVLALGHACPGLHVWWRALDAGEGGFPRARLERTQHADAGRASCERERNVYSVGISLVEVLVRKGCG